MFWLPRRKYSEPLHKIWTKYFISTQIKTANISNFDPKYINLINSISKDEIPKNEMYALNDNDSRDNQQYLIDILKLNNPISDNYLQFMKLSLDIYQKNDIKEIKQLYYVNHIFMRAIIRFIYLFTLKIEQKISPIPESEELSQQYSAIINIGFCIFNNYANDLIFLYKQFFQCLFKNYQFIMENDTLRLFACRIVHQSLRFIQISPFSNDFHVFLFTVLINYFTILKMQMSSTNLLNDEVESIKLLLNFIAANFKFISQKHSTHLTTFFDILYQIYNLFPLNNSDVFYSLGFCSLSFYKSCLKINPSYILNNPNFLDSIIFLIWSLDNFSIQKYPQPTFQFSNNLNSSQHIITEYLNCLFVDSPPLFAKNQNKQEINEQKILENFTQIVPEVVLNVLNNFTDIITSLNNSAFQTKVFEYLSRNLINAIENGQLPRKAQNDYDSILFFISFTFSYIGYKLQLDSSDHCHFVILFNKVFYTDNEQNYNYHSFFRSFIFRLFVKIFKVDPILVIDGYQQVLNDAQFHVCDEIFYFFSYLLKINSASFIENISLLFYTRYFVLLQKFNENRPTIVYLIENIFANDTGRLKFLSNNEFVHSIFNFLFFEQTRDDVSEFISSSYEKESNLDCYNLAFKTFSFIYNSSKLPETKWIEFFMHFNKLLKPIISKGRTLIIGSNEYSNLFNSLKNIFCALKIKEERCLIVPFLNLITIFTTNDVLYRKRCLKIYSRSIPIFENIIIENTEDEIIKEVLNHIFEYNVNSFSDQDFTQLIFKNANALMFLHHSTKNYPIHKSIFEKIELLLHADLANQTIISNSGFPFVLIDFLRNNMNHPSFPTFLLLFDDIFSNNFDIKYFLHLSVPPENSSLEVQNNWKRYVFQIIEALSARNEKDLSFKYIFLNGEKTEISLVYQLVIPFEIKMNMLIQLYPKDYCDLISFYFKTKQTTDIFRIIMDNEGKIFIQYNSFLTTMASKPSLVYKLETGIQIPKNVNIEMTVGIFNGQINFFIKESANYTNSEFIQTESSKSYEIKCQVPDFLNQKVVRITLFNSAKSAKKHSICAFLFYFAIAFIKSNVKKIHICLNLFSQNASTIHMNRVTDFEINGVVKYHATNVFTFMKKESGSFYLLEMVDNPILFLHFIHIIVNLMNRNEKFENYFFKYIFPNIFFGIQKLNLICWNIAAIKSFSRFTLTLHNTSNSELLLKNIWLHFDQIWLNIEDKEIQHYVFSEVYPKFCEKFEDFFKDQTNSMIYSSAIQKSLDTINDEVIMNDLLNILFFYLKNGCKENDTQLIKSFILNSDKTNLRIQFNLRLFGIIDFDSQKTISLLDKFETNDQYQFFFLFFNDLCTIEREYIAQFITEESFNILSNEFVSNNEMQNIFFDLIIVISEYVSSELLTDFISKLTSDYLITKILSSDNLDLRTTLLIFVQFHSSTEESYDISQNQILIKFYSQLLAKNSSFVKNFFLTTLLMSSAYHFDCAPFIRFVFLSTLSLFPLIKNIDLVLFYAFCFIFFIAKNDYYYDNVCLHNLFEEQQYHINNENSPKLKQISIFEFMKTCRSIDYQSLFPLRFSLRIDENGNWLDKTLALSLVSHYESKDRLKYQYSFTRNQSIYGIQIVSTLFIFLIKTNHSHCLDSASFFLQNYPSCGPDISSHEKASIQCLCYAMIPILDEFKTYENSFRVLCHRFSVCFEEAAETISNDECLAESMKESEPMKESELKVIINSFSDVYYFHLLLLKNLGTYLSMTSSEFLSHYSNFMQTFSQVSNVEKISLFDPDQLIDSITNKFKYNNDLHCLELANNESCQEKPFIHFNDSFHPVMFTSFSWKFIPYEETIDFTQKDDDNLILIKHIKIITLYDKISTYFIQRNEQIIIGGYSSTIDSIKWVFQRLPNQIEFFYKTGGLMLLIEFDSQLEESFVNQFPSLEEKALIEQWNQQEITNYDFILGLNFLNGKTFNDLENYIIFPRLLNNIKLHSNMIKENSFRSFQAIFKQIDISKITEIHKHSNILNSINEEQCEIIPELFSMNEVSSSIFTKTHLQQLESFYVSSQIHLWINNKFNMQINEKENKNKDLLTKKTEFEITPISRIVFNPFDACDGSFFSISLDDQLVISKLKKGLLVHLKIPFDQTFESKHTSLFAFPQEKVFAICRRNYTGFKLFSYETPPIKSKNKIVMSSLVDKIGRLDGNKIFVLASSKRLTICDNWEKRSSFVEYYDVLTANSNYFINLTMLICQDGNVVFVSNDSLMFQRSYKIMQKNAKFCILDSKCNAVVGSEDEVISYDINGKILASSKSNRKITSIYHVIIHDEDFIVLTTETPNLYIVNSETLETVYTIRTANPIVSFVFDYDTSIAILYDNWSTFFISF